MVTKLFLKGFNCKKSSNTSSGLNVQFKGRKKLLPLNDVDEVVSQYDQYVEERNKCNTIRLTCQVNPICSNVLFNRITEIVHNEGSSAVTFINYSLCPSGDTSTFGNVKYKPDEMKFWNSGDMKYQSVDDNISQLQPSTNLYDIIDKTTHNANGVLEGIEHPTNAIRDTQLSKNNVGFVYHCGLDFLNNHLVRSNTFKIICKCPDNLDENYTAFNTIADLMRSVNGEKVVEKLYFPTSESSLSNSDYLKILSLHAYKSDDILSYAETLEKRLIPKYNGWLGFHNRPKIKSYSSFKGNESMDIERPLSYFSSGDFIDMYPGRDLYSFVPKYNNFQKRIEKNWNYNITYPSSSYTPSSYSDPFADIFEINNGINSLRAVYFDENTRADNGVSQLVIYGISKHGLSVGDYVNIYKTYETSLHWVSKKISGETYERVTIKYEDESKANDELILLRDFEDYGHEDDYYRLESSATEVVTHKILDNAEVSDVVNDYIFVVFNTSEQISGKWADVSGINENDYNLDESGHFYTNKNDEKDKNKYYVVNGKYVNLDRNSQRISYKKTYGDMECEYYIRIFSKLPNFKFSSGDTSSEYEIYKNRDGGSMLSVYQGNEYNFENHISRLAFAKNIYTDEVGEIVFTDDIDISNIHDNLGRPLTSLYLTFIKNNKGYKEWYGWNNDDWDASYINEHYKSIEYSHCFGPVTCGIKASEESKYDNTINSIFTINCVNGISGYNIDTINGKRDNVDEKELCYDTDKHFYGDLCYYDNYNAIERHIEYINHRFSTAQRELSCGAKSKEYFKNYMYDEIVRDDYDMGGAFQISSYTNGYDCTSLKEGYYYNPHYEIPIKTFDKIQTVFPDFLTIRQFRLNEDGTYTFTTLEQHYLGNGDKAMLFDMRRNKYYKLVTVGGESYNYNVFTCKVYDEYGDEPVSGISYLNSTEDEENVISDLSTSTPIGNIKVSDFKLFKMDNLDIPSYARVLKDGTCRIIWRNILNNGFNSSDKSVEEYPFTNGAFYINKRIDLYVRRQDPYNDYHLYHNSDIGGNVINIEKEDNYLKDTDIEC